MRDAGHGQIVDIIADGDIGGVVGESGRRDGIGQGRRLSVDGAGEPSFVVEFDVEMGAERVVNWCVTAVRIT